MLFNSFAFFVFFIVVCVIYFVLPHRFRWPWLLGASWWFYACWNLTYLSLLIGKTFVTQAFTLQIEKSEGRARWGWLLATISFNFIVLFVFKYYNFFWDSARSFLRVFGVDYATPALNVLLPVGISFYTFQAVGYAIDVYRGKIRAEKHAGIFALFVAFFPQLIAGPIERAAHLLPQFRREVSFDASRVFLGLQQMLWGLFLKVVIADRLALYVNAVYDNPGAFDGPPVWIATYFFAFQIYCDFAGYSHIAIGAARVLGFDLMENFRRPYFSPNIVEFWRRWHISLSTWIRDYLYFPLGGNRLGLNRTYLNLAIVFLLSGLWHGAQRTFVVWGALHALFMIAALWLSHQRFQFNLPRWVRVGATFHIVCLTWIFFRASSLNDAWTFITHLSPIQGASSAIFLPKIGVAGFGLSLLGIAFLLFVERSTGDENLFDYLAKKPRWQRWGFFQILIAAILFLRVWNEIEFLYFQF